MLKHQVFALVCLLALCISQASAQNEIEAEKARRDAARALFSSLFGNGNPIDPAEVPNLLRNLQELSTPGFLNPPMDLDRLIDFANVNQEKCFNVEGVKSMRKEYNMAKRNYKALLPYISQNFVAQFKLCGFDVKFKEDFKNFKEVNPKRWSTMKNYRRYLDKYGKFSKGTNKLDNPIQFNDAVRDIYYSEHQNPYGAINLYNQVREFRDGAIAYGQQVAPSVDLATYNPEGMQDPELRDSLRDVNAYGQAVRTNYEPAISEAIADAHYDKGDSFWKKYMQYQSDWGLI